LLLRTPYGAGTLDPQRIATALPELAADGYIIVSQDIRGRFKSEGQFVMLRQPREPKDKNAIDESTDAYDSIEWLLKNVRTTTAVSAWLARAMAPG
jgi:predicted acyl esterase